MLLDEVSSLEDVPRCGHDQSRSIEYLLVYRAIPFVQPVKVDQNGGWRMVDWGYQTAVYVIGFTIVPVSLLAIFTVLSWPPTPRGLMAIFVAGPVFLSLLIVAAVLTYRHRVMEFDAHSRTWRITDRTVRSRATVECAFDELQLSVHRVRLPGLYRWSGVAVVATIDSKIFAIACLRRLEDLRHRVPDPVQELRGIPICRGPDIRLRAVR